MLFAGFTRVVRYAVLYPLFPLLCGGLCVCGRARGPRSAVVPRLGRVCRSRFECVARVDVWCAVRAAGRETV